MVSRNTKDFTRLLDAPQKNMKSKIFLAKIVNGKIDFKSHNALRFLDWVKNNEGKTIRISTPDSKRSTSQNAYMWLYLGVISQETGDDANSLHEYFKRTLLPPKFIKVMGKEIKIPQSTTELSKSDMSEYLDRICNLTGVPLPDRELAGYYIEQ